MFPQVVVPDTDPQVVVELYLFDTSGQDMFRPMAARHWENASMLILVYDVTSPSSFENLEQWVQHFKTVNPGRPLCGCVVANKIDLSERIVVPREHGETFAREHELEFFDASAQDNVKVDIPFMYVASRFKDMYEERLNDFASV